jgi:hypothetical protein
VKLCPTVLGVIDIDPNERQAIPDAWARQVAVVAGHELDHQISALLGVVIGHQHAPVLRIEGDKDVNVPILLVSHVLDRA